MSNTIEDEIKDVQQLVLNELIQRNGLSSTIANSSITTDKLADGAVTSAKLASSVSFAPATGSINTNQLANSAVNSAKLASNAVIEAKIADNAVTTNKIQDGAVTTAKLASTVSLNIADASITTAKIADTAITTTKIANGAVIADKLGSDVDLGQVNDSAVTTAKLAVGAVTGSKIGASEVGTLAVADTAITTAKIADDAITEAKLSQAYLPLAGGSLTGNLGIGTTTAPADELHIKGTTPVIRIEDTGGGYATLDANDGTLVMSADVGNSKDDSFIKFNIDGSDAMRIDENGNVLVGTTDIAGGTSGTTQGIALSAGSFGGFIGATRSDSKVVSLNRTTSDGEIIDFRKDGSTAGKIGTYSGGIFEITGESNVVHLRSNGGVDSTGNKFYLQGNILPWANDYFNLGASNYSWNDIYATNGTIQTSDANDKQDIEALSEAEQRVAVACKGLLRKFRWKSAVEEKGEEARIHFGIIAQDLQAAFEAEGLDAGRYGMFISSTWTDEETGEEKTRLGVRYSELLAFIISAI